MNDNRAQSSPAKSSVGRIIRRLLRRVYGLIGGVANVLGIYAFGESKDWWRLQIALSPQAEQAVWMIAVGVGGPWAMILGAWLSARMIAKTSRDTISVLRLIEPVINVSFFFALLHCAQMSFGLIIFPNYLTPTGFVKVFGIYLAIGIGFGTLMSLVHNRLSRRLLSALE